MINKSRKARAVAYLPIYVKTRITEEAIRRKLSQSEIMKMALEKGLNWLAKEPVRDKIDMYRVDPSLFEKDLLETAYIAKRMWGTPDYMDHTIITAEYTEKERRPDDYVDDDTD